VSARDALRVRIALRPGASEDDLVAFRRVAFGRMWEKTKESEIIRWGGCLWFDALPCTAGAVQARGHAMALGAVYATSTPLAANSIPCLHFCFAVPASQGYGAGDAGGVWRA
jgi:hypothetical protein